MEKTYERWGTQTMSQKYAIVERLHLCADADVRETGRDGTFEQADAEKWALTMEQAASLIQELGDTLGMARYMLSMLAPMADQSVGEAVKQCDATLSKLINVSPD